MYPPINSPIIELDHVTVDGVRLAAPLHFNVTRGEFILLTGATGSGKSIALSLIAGLIRATSGQVLVARECINNFTVRQMALLRRSMGLMLPECLLLEDQNVLENVMLPAIASGQSFQQARQLAKKALRDCDIEDLAELMPYQLSSGQKQYTALARAIANSPPVVLADEPAAHLDVDHAQRLMDLLGKVSLSGVAVVVASHLQVLPTTVGCRTICLDDARRTGS